MIHVCYGLHDRDGRYSKFTGTSMLSIFENVSSPPPSVTVHILHDNTLSYDNWRNFIYIAGRYGQRVEFHNVEQLCADKIQFIQEKLSSYLGTRFSIGAFYRLMINHIGLRNVSKMIYLDADTIVNLDLQELWNYSLENHALAAVPEWEATRTYMITNKYVLHTEKVKLEDYLCSGIIMMNLDKFGEDFFYDGVNWLAENLQCESPDQDILNNFFSTNYLKLPEKFDAFVGVCRYLDNNALLPKIYHYAGNCLGMNMNDTFNRLFFTHFTKTPWFGLETIHHTYETMSQIYIERQTFAIQIANLLARKKRAFLVSNRNLEGLKEVFAINDTEEIFTSDDDDAFSKLIEAMNKSRGEKIFFILIDNFNELNAVLHQMGFVAGEDFLDVTAFLHDGHGVPLPAFTLVKLL
ncbi:MAG: hypothetical protein J5809_03680 [Selenomonadaceae bacterium]|nr:hypothetical protein [Selenomonadaceae bacterium]